MAFRVDLLQPPVSSAGSNVIFKRQTIKYLFCRASLRSEILSEDKVAPEDRSGDWKQDAVAVSPKSQKWQWAMTVAYDGTKYSGWQIQRRAVTVQKTIEDVLSRITRCTQDELSLSAASRTDAGVHAWGQVASFTTPFVFEHLDKLHRSMNAMLPPDVRIREVQAVQPDFHVRYHPTSKRYQYKAYMAPVMDPCKHSYALHLPYAIDLDAMQDAASLFIGVHNFSAFANASSKALLSPVREIYKFTVLSSGPDLLFEVEGKSFLYKQVRNMVGLLLEIGKGTVPSSAVSDILASENRQVLASVSSTAPAHGLYLMSLNYDEALFLDVPKASYGRLRFQKISDSELNCVPIFSAGKIWSQVWMTSSYGSCSATEAFMRIQAVALHHSHHPAGRLMEYLVQSL